MWNTSTTRTNVEFEPSAVSDCVRTSLGPRGMDKMIITKDGETVITNDGATMLKHLSVMHPAARMVSR